MVTPTLATTTPSKSINLTRLLLSLDSSPNNRDEITLASKMLSNVDFQQRLKQIDLNVLDSSSKELNIDLVSVKEAVEHLNLSQQYIEDNFTSDDIIYEPVNKHLKHIIIKKKKTGKVECVLTTLNISITQDIVLLLAIWNIR